MPGKFTRRFVVCSVAAAALVTTASVTPAFADTPTPGTAGSCTPGAFGNRPYCNGAQVTVLERNTANCQGNDQYFNTNDLNNVPISWTYSNGSHACIRVRYTPPGDDANCDYWFYVPRGHATAPIVFGYWDKSGTKRYASLNENTHEGWTFAFKARSVNRIEFQDNNGQGTGQIGWGNGSGYGFWTDNCN